jgi:tryptophan synthase alpha chain
MTRLEGHLRRLRERGGKAFVPYVMLGDPDLDASLALARDLAAAGADAVELGVPFSDPLADGPVIQAAGHRALARGFRVADAFTALARLRGQTDVPLLLMVYHNTVLQRVGFVAEAAAAGAAGLLVPDQPREESAEMAARCRAAGMDLIPFVAPTSTDERIVAAAAEGGGFVYGISLTGVTGAREALSGRVPDLARRVRAVTDLPLLIGFGIAGPEQAAAAAREADGVIVGSAIVGTHHQRGPAAALELARAIRGVLPRGG